MKHRCKVNYLMEWSRHAVRLTYCARGIFHWMSLMLCAAGKQKTVKGRKVAA